MSMEWWGQGLSDQEHLKVLEGSKHITTHGNEKLLPFTTWKATPNGVADGMG